VKNAPHWNWVELQSAIATPGLVASLPLESTLAYISSDKFSNIHAPRVHQRSREHGSSNLVLRRGISFEYVPLPNVPH
jgi:hypothetical protein